MRLVGYNCIESHRLPEDPDYRVEGETDGRMIASYTIVMALPDMVASAINQNSGQRTITPRQVRVDLGTTSRWARNGSEAQIVVRPDQGGPEDSLSQRERRVGIVRVIMEELRQLNEEALRWQAWKWPASLDIVVLGGDGTTGCSLNEQLNLTAAWGGAEQLLTSPHALNNI